MVNMELGFDTIGNATIIAYDRRPIIVTDPWVRGTAYFGSWGMSHEIPEEQMEAVLALVGHRFKLGEDWGLLTQAAYQLTDYNFTDDSGSLWEDIHQFTVTAILTYQMNDA